MTSRFHVVHDDKEEFGSRNGCLSFLCFDSENLGGRTGYKSLQHKDGAANVGCWEGGLKRPKNVSSQSVGCLGCNEAESKLLGRQGSNNISMKNRKGGFTYESRSYRLNFDDGDAADSIPRAADAPADFKTQR